MTSMEVAKTGERFNTTVLKSARGKVLGTRTTFTTTGSAKDIKESLKAKGKTGKDLKDAVNAVLRGEIDLRTQLGVAWLQASYAEGFVPDIGDLRKNSGSLKLVKAGDDAMKKLESDNAAMAKELAELRAKILATPATTTLERFNPVA